MDGLETCEIKLSELLDNNLTKRIDSEYFRKLYVNSLTKLKQYNRILIDYYKVAGGKRLPENASFSESGIKYARAEDIKSRYLNVDNSPYISVGTHEYLNRYTTIKNDVLVTIVGNGIGDVAINKLDEKINLTENCVRIYSKSNKQNSILFVFLLSKYGQLQIIREKVGTAQPKLSIERIRNLFVPKFKEEFQDMIYHLIENSWQSIEDSKDKYREAENILDNLLNINSIKNNLFSIRSLSNSIRRFDRLDAEYYQSKYDELIANISNFDFKKLGGKDGLVDIIKSIEPGSTHYQNVGIPFVRVGNIDKFGISDTEIKLSKDVITDVEKLFPKKDTILLSKDGSVGIAYKVEEDLEIITSGALLHLLVRDKKLIIPDYLALILNSPIVQLQAERDCNGAIIQHWKPSDIKNILIPILGMEKQKEISDLIKKSFEMRKQSNRILEKAIKALELAIEIDEQKALLWLKSQNFPKEII